MLRNQAASPWFCSVIWHSLFGKGFVDGGIGAPAAGGFFQRRFGAEVAVDNLHAVEPVLDVVAFDDDARLVVLADGLGGGLRGGDHRIERASLIVGAALGVGVAGVVDHLIFECDDVFLRGLRAFEFAGPCAVVGEVFKLPELLRAAFVDEEAVLHAILQSAVAFGFDLPFPCEFEIAKLGKAEEVFAEFGMRDGFQGAVFDDPGIAGGRELGDVFPAFHRFAVEEQLPAGLLFGGGEGVGGVGGRQGNRAQCSEKQ